jgi:cysteinyl-tRNA synthetase
MMTNNAVLTSEILETTHAAFGSYLESKLVKCLPTFIERPSGSSSLEHFDAIVNKDQTDEAWAAEARTKDEKFGMHVASLIRARDAIRIAEDQMKSAKPESFGATAGQQAVFDLVGGAYDVLGLYLGTTVGAVWKLGAVEALADLV